MKMKDIKLDTWYKKIQNVIAWLGFVIFGGGIIWIIAIVLARKGKNNMYNTKPKSWVLNKTWQKFRYIYGSITADTYLAIWLMICVMNYLAGKPL